MTITSKKNMPPNSPPKPNRNRTGTGKKRSKNAEKSFEMDSDLRRRVKFVLLRRSGAVEFSQLDSSRSRFYRSTSDAVYFFRPPRDARRTFETQIISRGGFVAARHRGLADSAVLFEQKKCRVNSLKQII